MDSLKNSRLPEIAFIVGMGRSGTTLLTNMLNSNPSLISTPENEFILFLYQSFHTKNFADKEVMRSFTEMFGYEFNRVLSFWKPREQLINDLAELSPKNYANACKAVYLNYPFASNREDIQCIVDKNPLYSLHIKRMKTLYPRAKFIIIVRDYRDNILSRKKYSDSQSSLFRLAASWNYFYKKIEQNEQNLDAYVVRYEDLVSEPEKKLREICTFLDVAYSDNMLHFQDLSRDIKKHIRQNSSQEMFDKINAMHANLENNVNVNRVNAYEGELSATEIAQLDYACRKYGQKYGYAPHPGSAPPRFSWKLRLLFAEAAISLYYVTNAWWYKVPLKLKLLKLKKK